LAQIDKRQDVANDMLCVPSGRSVLLAGRRDRARDTARWRPAEQRSLSDTTDTDNPSPLQDGRVLANHDPE
jgi:hypothetical protein